MGYKARAGVQPVDQEDAEEDGGVPQAQSQVDAARPGIIPSDVDSVVEDDGSGLAGGASGGTGGASGTAGHPDASR